MIRCKISRGLSFSTAIIGADYYHSSGVPGKVPWLAGITHCCPPVLSHHDRKPNVHMYCEHFNKPKSIYTEWTHSGVKNILLSITGWIKKVWSFNCDPCQEVFHTSRLHIVKSCRVYGHLTFTRAFSLWLFLTNFLCCSIQGNEDNQRTIKWTVSSSAHIFLA